MAALGRVCPILRFCALQPAKSGQLKSDRELESRLVCLCADVAVTFEHRMKMLMKPKQLRPLPATESEPHPREFVIGSDKSRAAARMLASRKENSEFKIQVNTSIPGPGRTSQNS